ncbi:MAG: efflux RND transporter periplasmic adaptor subunit [Gemmataceae bacterium]|nr:efflux RND transporter periplasmic adaptor subunit [Gemmataceae bacterium]MCI0743709.1 efflux RND transporter periplasmic adaptor subunit [Gemmataceae bacterium]
MRHRTWACAAGFVFAVLLAGCQRAAPQMPTPPPPPVTVASPTRLDLADYRDYTGRVEPVETEEVRARVKGFLSKIHFQEGAEVEKGDLLYEIDPRTFQADLDKAKAQVAQAKTHQQLAIGEAERAIGLRASRAISEEQYQQTIATRNAAESALQQANASLESAKLELEFTKIRAKIDGKISRTLVTQGNLVGFNQPTLLTNIVRLDQVYVYFEETERGLDDFDKLARAKKVANIVEAKIPVQAGLAWENGHPHKGLLDFRDNKIDPGTGTIQLRALMPNSQRTLIPGQFVRVRVALGAPKPRLLVPEQALQRDPNGKYLLIVKDDNMVERRAVTTTLLHEGQVVIDSGLQAQDRVIINGLQRARPGAPVAPRNEDSKAS